MISLLDNKEREITKKKKRTFEELIPKKLSEYIIYKLCLKKLSLLRSRAVWVTHFKEKPFLNNGIIYRILCTVV